MLQFGVIKYYGPNSRVSENSDVFQMSRNWELENLSSVAFILILEVTAVSNNHWTNFEPMKKNCLIFYSY